MAFARPQAALDENRLAKQALGDAKGSSRVPLGGTGRRALGDIGNTIVSQTQRTTVSAKDGAGPAAGGQIKERARRAAAPAGAGWGVTKPRSTRSGDAQVASVSQQHTRTEHDAMVFGSEKSQSAHLHATSQTALYGATPMQEDDMFGDLPDIDAADKNNELCCVEYINDIFAYYRRVEREFCAPFTYMENQRDINEKMRAILIDWLVEVHLKFKLMPETLHLTSNVIDRYLANKPVTRKNLQLVGVTAMLIASKYEEIWAPEINDFVYISDKAYTREEIIAMERQMLNTLHFNLTVPTQFPFVQRFIKAAGGDKQLGHLTAYLVELAMLDYTMIRYVPSHLAAAALYTATRALKHPMPWFPVLQRHTGYSYTQLRPCSSLLAALWRRAPKATLKAVQKKYSSVKYGEVAMLAPLQDSALSGCVEECMLEGDLSGSASDNSSAA
eukprot:jgi/Chlat1/6800/Chrsp51S06559